MDASDDVAQKDPYDAHRAESQTIDEMPGRSAVAHIDMVKRINAILSGNISEFARIIQRMNDDPAFSSPILDIGRPELHEAFLGECERLLHNALSTVHSRVDLLRTYVKRHFVTELPRLAAEYDTRIGAAFRNNLLHRFLIELRNYVLHNRLPVARSQQLFSTNPDGSSTFEFKLTLSTTHLLDNADLPAQVHAWASALGDDFDVLDLLRQYHHAVQEFDAWLVAAIWQHYANDIAKYEAAARAFNAKWYPWDSGTTPASVVADRG